MNWIQRFLTAITTHKGDAAAHHAKTVSSDLEPGGSDPIRWGLNKLLLGAGAGSDPTEIDVPAAGAPTKEFSMSPTSVGGTATMHNRTYCAGARLKAVNDSTFFWFRVPHDFSSITSAEIIVCPVKTQAAADWDIYSVYGAVGESMDIHAEIDAASTYNVLIDIYFAVDISGILSSLVAGDNVGIAIYQRTVDHDVYVMGIRFRYS